MSQKGSIVVETHLYKDNDIFIKKILNTILYKNIDHSVTVIPQILWMDNLDLTFVSYSGII